MTPHPETRQPAKRRHDLDALRAFAMLLGIALHAACAYSMIPWPVMDTDQSSLLFLLFIWLVHGFRMPLFFVVSGYFTAMLASRKGIRAMLANRAARILAPCLTGLVTIVPLTLVTSSWALTHNARHPRSPLFQAIVAGDTTKVANLLDRGEPIEQTDERLGSQPLVWAVLWESEPIARLLLERGADPMATTRLGGNALCAAAFLGNRPMLEILVRAGGDPLASPPSGVPPVKVAAIDPDRTQAMIRFMKGAEEPTIDKVISGRREVLAYLRDQGAATEQTENAKDPNPADWAQAYVRWLASDAFKVGFGSVRWNLFNDSCFAHLWFLWFLCWLVPAYAAWASLGRGLAFGLKISPAAAMCVAAATTLGPQWLMGADRNPFDLQGLVGPETSGGALPKPHVLGYYAIFFFFGTWYFDAPEIGARLGSGWKAWIPLAVFVFFPLALATQGRSYLNAMAQVAFTWMMVLGMIGVFKRFASRESRLARYVSDASYWMYLVHLPMVIAGQLLLADWAAPAPVKCVVLLAGTMAILIASYQLLVRHTAIGLFLNGPRPQEPTTSKLRSGNDAGQELKANPPPIP
jgi:peptidoglycan/LPS O-acetylase OafA/YrhL